MNIEQIVDFAQAGTAAEHYRPAPEKVLKGDPEQSVRNHYSSPCGQFSTGIWECAVGQWTLSYTEHEYCEILQGVSVLRDADGNAIDGEVAVVLENVDTGDVIPATVDANGDYTAADVPAGNYRAKASANGYRPTSAPTVTRETVEAATTRSPAISTGTASGSSTESSRWTRP